MQVMADLVKALEQGEEVCRGFFLDEIDNATVEMAEFAEVISNAASGGALEMPSCAAHLLEFMEIRFDVVEPTLGIRARLAYSPNRHGVLCT